ncbi:MAG TPA: hypothetical protein VLG47_05300 [Candidatus Saccharimonadales bacterium]|nr:hypothetical protein [Candidatus Saccharimonadales bacterium]
MVEGLLKARRNALESEYAMHYGGAELGLGVLAVAGIAEVAFLATGNDGADMARFSAFYLGSIITAFAAVCTIGKYVKDRWL